VIHDKVGYFVLDIAANDPAYISAAVLSAVRLLGYQRSYAVADGKLYLLFRKR